MKKEYDFSKGTRGRFYKKDLQLMNVQELLKRITVYPDVMVGKPSIRGLRITVEQILQALANGRIPQELINDYPELEPEDIQAVLLYAVELVSEKRVFKIHPTC